MVSLFQKYMFGNTVEEKLSPDLPSKIFIKSFIRVFMVYTVLCTGFTGIELYNLLNIIYRFYKT